MAKRLLLVVAILVTCAFATAQSPPIQDLLKSIHRTSRAEAEKQWTLASLFEHSQVVVVAEFDASKVVGHQNVPDTLELVKNHIELVESTFAIKAVLKSEEKRDWTNTLSVKHFRFARIPRFASQPPGFIDFQKEPDRKMHVLFLNWDAKEGYNFTSGPYFDCLSVMSIEPSVSQLEADRLRNPEPAPPKNE